jgi:regulatory protein
VVDSDGEHVAPVTYLFGAPAVVANLVATVDGTSIATPNGALDAGVGADLGTVWIASRDDDSPSERLGKFASISNISMAALARRGMSAEEMASYLASRDFDGGEVELECERLLGVGLLDDFALASTLVRTLRDRKGLGRSSITAELRRRRIDQAAIEEALDEVDDDELERAILIAQKRAPQLRSLDATTAKRRLGAFLQRKGYSGSVISTAVSRALEPAGPVFR